MTEKQSPVGYMLLRLIRKYIVCDMYMGLEVQTEESLQKLDNAITDFGDTLDVSRTSIWWMPLINATRFFG